MTTQDPNHHLNGHTDPYPRDDGPDIDPDPQPSGRTAKHTDLSNAEKLRELHGENLHYVGAWKKWLAWDDRRWRLDTDALAFHYATETVRVLCEEAIERINALMRKMKAAGEVNDELRDEKKEADKDFAHAAQSQASSKVSSLLTMATGFREFAVRFEDLDVDPWMLNVGNGTLNLRTAKLLPHLRSENITLLTPVNYDEDMGCPTWLAFLDRCMGGDARMLTYLQRLVGYTLTGKTTEHVFAFHYGGGANGKSTFLSTLHALLGEYGAPAHPKLVFRSSNGDRHLTERATLFRKRFITCPETSEAQGFDEATVKDLTGGDVISARRMREDEWSFTPTHKLHLAGNEKPVVRATDDGFWRRVHLVPWTVTIPQAERDRDLGEKLRDELPGILSWAVQGCLEWQRNGLAAPDQVRAAVLSYRQQSDTFGLFLAAVCHVDPAHTVTKKRLREAYEGWCREQGYEPLGARRVAEALRKRQVIEGTLREGHNVSASWKGVGLTQ